MKSNRVLYGICLIFCREIYSHLTNNEIILSVVGPYRSPHSFVRVCACVCALGAVRGSAANVLLGFSVSYEQCSLCVELPDGTDRDILTCKLPILL